MATVGDRLQGQHGEYELTGFLGEGLTARVYRGRASYLDQEVAVKVLKPGLDSEVVKRFTGEAGLIGEVLEGLKNWGNDRGPKPAQPPKFHELYVPDQVSTSVVSPDGQPSRRAQSDIFMVMDLISVPKIEDLLAQQGGPLAESEGLAAGVQLFGLFKVLHEQVGRTYTDFKVENLWWQRDEQRLWVTDWNVLSKKGQLEGVPRDLERAARALMMILTGQPLPLGRALSQHPGWHELSPGAQQAMGILLHPVPARRPASAAEVYQILLGLFNAWQSDVKRVMADAEDALTEVEYWQATEKNQPLPTTLERAGWQATANLGVLRARQAVEQGASSPWPQPWVVDLDALWGRAAQHVADVQRLIDSATQMIEAGSAGVACELLEQALLEFPDELAAHRLLDVARSIDQGRAPAMKLRQALLHAVDRCNQGNFTGAQAGLKPFPVNPDKPHETAAMALRGEIMGRLLWKQALTEVDAGKALRIALEAQSSFDELDVSYRDAVIASLDTNFWERLVDLQRQAQLVQRQQQAQRIAGNLQTLDLSTALRLVVEHLPLYADQTSMVEESLNLAQRCLEHHRQPELARQIYATGLRATRNSFFAAGPPTADPTASPDSVRSGETSDQGIGVARPDESAPGQQERSPVLPVDKAPLFRAGWHVASALVQFKKAPLDEMTYQALKEVAENVVAEISQPEGGDKQRYVNFKEALTCSLSPTQAEAVRSTDDVPQDGLRRLARLHDDLKDGVSRSIQQRVKSALEEGWNEDKAAVRPVIGEILGLPKDLLPLMEDLFRHPETDWRQDFETAETDRDKKAAIGAALGFDALLAGIQTNLDGRRVSPNEEAKLKQLLVSKLGLSDKALKALEQLSPELRVALEGASSAREMPRELARALPNKLLVEILASKEPGQFTEEASELLAIQWGLTPDANIILKQVMQANGGRFGYTTSANEAELALARSLGLPTRIGLLRDLADDTPDKVQLAKDFRRLADSLDRTTTPNYEYHVKQKPDIEVLTLERSEADSENSSLKDLLRQPLTEALR